MDFQFQFPITFSFVLSLKQLAPLICIIAIDEEAKSIRLGVEIKGYETAFAFSRVAAFNPAESKRTWAAVNLTAIQISKMIQSVVQEVYFANRLYRPIEKSLVRVLVNNIVQEFVPNVSMPHFYAKPLSIYFILPCRKGYVFKGILFTDQEMVFVNACILPVSAEKALVIPEPKHEYWSTYQRDAVYVHAQNAAYNLQAEVPENSKAPLLVASEFEPPLRNYGAIKCKSLPALILRCAENLFEAEPQVKELAPLPINFHHNGRSAFHRMIEAFYPADASSKAWSSSEPFNYLELYKDDIEASEKRLEEEKQKKLLRSAEEVIMAACLEQTHRLKDKELELLEWVKGKSGSTGPVSNKKQKVDNGALENGAKKHKTGNGVVVVIPPKNGTTKSSTPEEV